MNVSQADVRTHSPAFAPCWDEEEKAPERPDLEVARGYPGVSRWDRKPHSLCRDKGVGREMAGTGT